MRLVDPSMRSVDVRRRSSRFSACSMPSHSLTWNHAYPTIRSLSSALRTNSTVSESVRTLIERRQSIQEDSAVMWRAARSDELLTHEKSARLGLTPSMFHPSPCLRNLVSHLPAGTLHLTSIARPLHHTICAFAHTAAIAPQQT